MEYLRNLMNNDITRAQIGFEYSCWVRNKLEYKSNPHKTVRKELKYFRNPYSEIPPKEKHEKHPLLNQSLFIIMRFHENRKIKLRKDFWKNEITNTPEEAQWFRDYEYMQEFIEHNGEDFTPDDTYATYSEFRDLIVYCRSNDTQTLSHVPIMTLSVRSYSHIAKKYYLASQINNL
jgi:hypothetical protein